MNRRTRIATMAILLGIIVPLSGCKVGPKYGRPQVTAPETYRGPNETRVSSARQDSLGDLDWAQVFHEPELQQLIRTALESNYDLQIAARRVAEQQAQFGIARSQEFPTVSVGGSGIGADLPSTLGSNLPSGTIAAGSFNLSAGWNPDFWGMYRRQTEAARARLLAQGWAQRAVRLTLVQEVASEYIRLRALDRQLAIAKQTLETRHESTELTRMLENGGSVPLSDLREAEELEYSASAQIPQTEQQIQQQENELRLLLGQNPGPVAHIDPAALTPPPQELPIGLPSRLLERRPDILEAEEQLVAANAEIGVARAQLFPQLAISSSGGVGGNDWSNLFDPSSRLIYGIGSLTQPIFEGGRLRGQVHLSEQAKEEMVLSYRKTIAGAFRDVSNALIATNKQRSARERQEKLVVAAQDAAHLARVRYQGGATSYLEVLTTDSNLFTAQLNLVNTQEGEALSLVQLYAALGGGWR